MVVKSYPIRDHAAYMVFVESWMRRVSSYPTLGDWLKRIGKKNGRIKIVARKWS